MIKNRILIKAYPYKPKSIEDAVAGDLLCYYNGSLLIYPSTQYGGTPIGVVVIPTSHNVYGDGSCGVMSLVPMDYNTPDIGASDDVEIQWGCNTINVSALKDYESVCHLGNGTSVAKSIKGVTAFAYLPSNVFSALKNPYDTDTYYYHSKTEQKYYIPSPYKEDESRNPQYYQTSSPSSDANALSDFNGILNTEIIISLATAQSDWKTASTITNSAEAGYYPAACCCWRFHPVGTKQGDWYLPACGELGYIMPKWNEINSTLTKVNGITLKQYAGPSKIYWSSTEASTTHSRGVFPYKGTVSYYSKDHLDYVRAFFKASPDIIKS